MTIIDVETGKVNLAGGSIPVSPSTKRSHFLFSVRTRIDRVKDWDIREIGRDDYELGCGSFNVLDLRGTCVFQQENLCEVRLYAKRTEKSIIVDDEKTRKAVHDAWLQSLMGDPPYYFSWGRILSLESAKGRPSLIAIKYGRSDLVAEIDEILSIAPRLLSSVPADTVATYLRLWRGTILSGHYDREKRGGEIGGLFRCLSDGIGYPFESKLDDVVAEIMDRYANNQVSRRVLSWWKNEH